MTPRCKSVPAALQTPTSSWGKNAAVLSKNLAWLKPLLSHCTNCLKNLPVQWGTSPFHSFWKSLLFPWLAPFMGPVVIIYFFLLANWLLCFLQEQVRQVSRRAVNRMLLYPYLLLSMSLSTPDSPSTCHPMSTESSQIWTSTRIPQKVRMLNWNLQFDLHNLRSPIPVPSNPIHSEDLWTKRRHQQNQFHTLDCYCSSLPWSCQSPSFHLNCSILTILDHKPSLRWTRIMPHLYPLKSPCFCLRVCLLQPQSLGLKTTWELFFLNKSVVICFQFSLVWLTESVEKHIIKW